MIKVSKNSIRMAASTGLWSFVCIALGFFYGLTWSVSENQAKEVFDTALRQVEVVAPSKAPEMSQASIEVAMKLYSIELPSNTHFPVLDMSLADRGSTLRSLAGDFAVVKIGPAAFESWSILASTLAHELEVHCRQSFPMIYALDMMGLEGTVIAERQAYEYELANAKRFGLDRGEANLIKNTLDFYYSYSSKPSRLSRMEFKPSLQAWFHHVFMSRIVDQ